VVLVGVGGVLACADSVIFCPLIAAAVDVQMTASNELPIPGGIASGAGVRSVARSGTEIVQRAMSRAEFIATQSSGLLRGGRAGTHYASDWVNATASRARERLALPQTPEVRATLEVPSGSFSQPSRVPPDFNMPGGGTQRTATGEIPVRVLKVDEY
jgi:hypothetical protein